MKTMSPLRLVSAAAILALSSAGAGAQTAAPAPAEKPAVAQPQAAPVQPAPRPSGPSATAGGGAEAMIGRNALSSDGNRVGDVRAVKTAPDGRITAIQLKVGGFLGFGGRMVEVTEDKFMQKGDIIQIDYTLDDVDKLPDAEDNS